MSDTEPTDDGKQYRVSFSYRAPVGGHMRKHTNGSTQWYDSRQLAEQSRWMQEEDAKIVSRDRPEPGPRPRARL